jgi:hypothetical protein
MYSIKFQVSDYVSDRIAALRLKHPGQYTNIACIRNVVAHWFFSFLGISIGCRKSKWSSKTISSSFYVLVEGQEAYPAVRKSIVEDCFENRLSLNFIFFSPSSFKTWVSGY